MGAGSRPHPQRSADTTDGRVTALSILGAFQIGKKLRKAPVLSAVRGPSVVARTVTADEDEAVDGRRAAEPASPWPGNNRSGLTLRNRGARPVHRRPLKRRPYTRVRYR